jgi:hypothetical protein
MQIKKVKLSELHLNTGQIPDVPKNPRWIKDNRFEKLKKSIEDDPEMLELREIIVCDNDSELVIICGNMRFRAMKELGIKETVIKVLPKETPAEKLRAYVIKDNVAFGNDDFDILANEWDSLELEEWGIELPACEDVDFNNIESNAERSSDKKNKEVTCPECLHKFEV